MRSSFVRAILDEVTGLDLVGPHGAKTDTGFARKSDATLLGFFGGDLQPSRRQILSTRLKS